MTLVERLEIATVLVVAAFVFGGIIFVLARGIIRKFAKRLSIEPVSRFWLVGALGYLVAVIYGFAIDSIVGFLLLVPLGVAVLMPEILFVNWRTESSVKLPEKVKLTNQLGKVGGKFETRVKIDGEDWTAELPDDGLAPPLQGEVVRVVERHGLRLVLARSE